MEQALVLNVRVNSTKAARIYLIFLAIFTVAYYIIAIFLAKNLRLDFWTE
jgi:hypothetical protein